MSERAQMCTCAHPKSVHTRKGRYSDSECTQCMSCERYVSSAESAACTCPATTWIGADENDSTCKAHSEESAAEEWMRQAAFEILETVEVSDLGEISMDIGRTVEIIRKHARKGK